MSGFRYHLFFDGTCGFCNMCVRFVKKRVLPQNHINYIPFEKITADKQKYLQKKNIPTDGSVVVFVDEELDQAYLRSTAIIKTFPLMKQPYRFMYYPSIMIPRVIRDAAYQLVATTKSWLALIIGSTSKEQGKNEQDDDPNDKDINEEVQNRRQKTF
eukprot:403348326